MLDQLRAEHPGVSVTVVEDAHGEGCWSTYRRALEIAGDAHHHIMLQDDLSLCADFICSVAGVIRARPSNLIALYNNAKTAAAVRERGEAWLESPGASGPSMIWPRRPDRRIPRVAGSAH